MKLKGAVTVDAPQEEVWRIFVDPVQLCRVIPGCENARQLDKTHYEAMVTVKVQFMTIRSKALGRQDKRPVRNGSHHAWQAG